MTLLIRLSDATFRAGVPPTSDLLNLAKGWTASYEEFIAAAFSETVIRGMKSLYETKHRMDLRPEARRSFEEYVRMETALEFSLLAKKQ